MIEEPNDDLISAAQAGDRDAMANLLREWNGPIFGFLLGALKNRADAEDAAQETFSRVVKGLPQYEHRGQFRAWIFRVARNQAALTAKRRQRLAAREEKVAPETLAAMAAGEEQGLEEMEKVVQLRQAVEHLPPPEREVVTMRLDEDLKFREIAERTGAPLNTVLGRMRSATRRLRESLTKQS